MPSCYRIEEISFQISPLPWHFVKSRFHCNISSGERKIQIILENNVCLRPRVCNPPITITVYLAFYYTFCANDQYLISPHNSITKSGVQVMRSKQLITKKKNNLKVYHILQNILRNVWSNFVPRVSLSLPPRPWERGCVWRQIYRTCILISGFTRFL